MSTFQRVRHARIAALAAALALVVTGLPMAAHADAPVDDPSVVELPGPAVEPAPVTFSSSVASGRISGPDRYSTSVQVSQRVIPAGTRAPVVYLASGESFPDALTAGPAASVREGVLLLVKKTEIPSAVAAEIARLDPERVIIAGGTGAVSAAVAAQVDALVRPGTSVTRLGGIDRYETGRKIVRDAFTGPIRVTRTLIATGLDFPDALAGGAASAAFGEPVIIVDGKADRLDAPTIALIDDLGVSKAMVAGGAGAVSDGILDQLENRLDVAERASALTGSRYHTATGINTTYFGRKFEGIPTQALVVSGTGYADALAAIPLAGKLARDSKFTGGAVYLATTTCIPAPGSHYIGGWDRVTLVGGRLVLGDEVASLAGCW
ncbi:hypothetical protein GCM10009775_18520 [Microbacterium aoyamense]|uniref:Cell wall binding repeat 2 n=1 Tax=Microbacterium aoyamense TaxID=344166 RepID=A0ABN2PPZ2_9MICO|nr:cell wall-binding repeat-containing protein [Microbacterium aoyamense]